MCLLKLNFVSRVSPKYVTDTRDSGYTMNTENEFLLVTFKTSYTLLGLNFMSHVFVHCSRLSKTIVGCLYQVR